MAVRDKSNRIRRYMNKQNVYQRLTAGGALPDGSRTVAVAIRVRWLDTASLAAEWGTRNGCLALSRIPCHGNLLMMNERIQSTYEIRWFLDTPLGDQLFADQPVAERTDWYAPHCSPEHSVKVRGEATRLLEAKTRVSENVLSEGEAAFPSGSLQSWIKRSTPLADSGLVEDAIVDVWPAVHKQRRCAYYALSEQGWQRVADRNVRGALQVEYTQVAARGVTAWTFALEAANDQDPARVADLLPTLHKAFPEMLDPARLQRPLSYPDWLLSLGI